MAEQDQAVNKVSPLEVEGSNSARERNATENNDNEIAVLSPSKQKSDDKMPEAGDAPGLKK